MPSKCYIMANWLFVYRNNSQGLVQRSILQWWRRSKLARRTRRKVAAAVVVREGAAVHLPTPHNSSSLIKGEIPDFGNIVSVTKSNYSSIYLCYKSATRRFLKYMRDNVPKHLIEDDTSINFLLTAADWMSANSQILDPNVMKDLKLCIRMRNRVAKSMFGGGDDGSGGGCG